MNKKICNLFPMAFDKYLLSWLNSSAVYVTRLMCSRPLLHTHCDDSA